MANGAAPTSGRRARATTEVLDGRWDPGRGDKRAAQLHIREHEQQPEDRVVGHDECRQPIWTGGVEGRMFVYPSRPDRLP